MKGIVAAVLFVVALAVAVVVLTRSEDERGLSTEDLAWVHRYGGWWTAELETLTRAFDASTQSTRVEQLQRPFAALRHCRPSYRRTAGPAPESLRTVESLSMEACSRAERALQVLRANPSVPVPRRTRLVRDAVRSLISADRELTHHLVLDSAPETQDEPTDESRTDVRYSAVATDVTAFNLDVRCWSEADWTAIQREVASLGAETAKKFFGAAGAFQGTVNLSPSTCATLDSLAYGGKSVPSRALVTALLTLGRESEQAHGFGDPREALCYGLQDVRGMATGLGASREEANRLAQVAWRLYRTKQVEPRRFTRVCRNDGPWDKRGENVWP